jgi:acetone carboxylase, beta subunit
VIVPAWAAGFSAFGCACADFEYRYDKSVDIALPQDAADEAKAQAYAVIEEAWKELAAKAVEEFVINGFKLEGITLLPGYRMQYMGQLNDIEITRATQRHSNRAFWAARSSINSRCASNIRFIVGSERSLD